MNYSNTVKMIDFLNNRMRKLKPWYTWGVVITWEKLERWARHLGWEHVAPMWLRESRKIAALDTKGE